MEPLLQIQENMLKKSLRYEKMFGSKPKKTRTPLMAGGHPENDLSDLVIKPKSNNIKQLLDS